MFINHSFYREEIIFSGALVTPFQFNFLYILQDIITNKLRIINWHSESEAVSRSCTLQR